jgi:hypothetical protein
MWIMAFSRFLRQANIGVREAARYPCFLFCYPLLDTNHLHPTSIGCVERIALQSIQAFTGIVDAQRARDHPSLLGTGADRTIRVPTPGVAAWAGLISQTIQPLPKFIENPFQARGIDITSIVTFLTKYLP